MTEEDKLETRIAELKHHNARIMSTLRASVKLLKEWPSASMKRASEVNELRDRTAEFLDSWEQRSV